MKALSSLTIFLIFNLTISQNELAFTLEDSDGSVLQDGSTLEFSTSEYPDASYNFFVRNLTSELINVKAEVLSFSGTDGNSMEFCFGECYFGVELNTSYPIGSFVTIDPGQTQVSTGDHFYNFDSGDGENPIEYSFRFFMVDENGDEVVSQAELKTDFLVHYYYSASLGLNDLDNFNFNYYILNDKLIIDSDSTLILKIYDFLGKELSQSLISIGNNSIELKNLSNNLVILSFESQENLITSKKILIP